MKTSYDKLFTSLKYYLLGRNYYVAIKALEFARKHHSGVRKDGSTPEFQHQLEICHFLMTLKNLRNEEVVLAVAILHDVMEDYNVSLQTMEEEFGKEVAKSVEILSKVVMGKKKEMDQYFEEIAKCPVASIVKGADRIHNLQSMVGVFTKEKQMSYMKEVEKYFLPMLKAAAYAFADQTMAYFNVKHVLKSQMSLIKASMQ